MATSSLHTDSELGKSTLSKHSAVAAAETVIERDTSIAIKTTPRLAPGAVGPSFGAVAGLSSRRQSVVRKPPGNPFDIKKDPCHESRL